MADLEAAGLQRRLGLAFASERQNRCRLYEAKLNMQFNQDVNSDLKRRSMQLNMAGGSSRGASVQSSSPVKHIAREGDDHEDALRECAEALRRTEASLRAFTSQIQDKEDSKKDFAS